MKKEITTLLNEIFKALKEKSDVDIRRFVFDVSSSGDEYQSYTCSNCNTMYLQPVFDCLHKTTCPDCQALSLLVSSYNTEDIVNEKLKEICGEPNKKTGIVIHHNFRK